MGEENTTGTDESQDTEKQSDESEQNDNGSDEDDNGGDSEDQGGEDDKSKADQGDDDEEPAVRKKTAKDYIIERKNKKIEKLKQKENDDKEEDDQEEDDDFSPEDEKVVDKIIQRKYGDKFAKLEQADDEKELQAFLTGNKDFAPYKAKIWKFWQHPSRNHLPVESVAYEVAGKDLLKIGARRGQQADDKARRVSTGGNSTRNSNGKVDYDAMSAEEFQQHVEAVKRKRQD